jgi:hypothetical protein
LVRVCYPKRFTAISAAANLTAGATALAAMIDDESVQDIDRMVVRPNARKARVGRTQYLDVICRFVGVDHGDIRHPAMKSAATHRAIGQFFAVVGSKRARQISPFKAVDAPAGPQLSLRVGHRPVWNSHRDGAAVAWLPDGKTRTVEVAVLT